MANTKITIEIPPELNWLIPYYEKKAELRAKLGSKGGIPFEFLNAIEQYAIQGLQSDVDFGMMLPSEQK